MTKKPFNGHESWAAWNVSLWINNDEGLYRWADGLVRRHGVERATDYLASELAGAKTPDGARYSRNTIRLALRGWT